MSSTSNRKSIIGRISLGLATGAAAVTVLGACSSAPGHSSAATVAPGKSAVHNVFTGSSHDAGDTGRIILTAKTSAQTSEQAVQALSDSLPNTPAFTAFKQGLFNATHNPLG